MGSNGISIIIPVKNNPLALESLLRSVTSTVPTEVIVVDSSSNDETVRIAKRYNCRTIKTDANRSKARNIGAREAKFDILLFLDSDMIIEKGLLEECLEKLNSYDALIFKEITTGTGMLSTVRRFQRVGYFHSLYLESPRCIRRNIFINLGGYNERMEGFEDLELTSRILNSKCKICWAKSTINHDESSVTVLEYILKRSNYLNFGLDFKMRDAQFYSKVFSVRTRAAVIFNSAKQNGALRSTLLIPGLLMILFLDAMLMIWRR